MTSKLLVVLSMIALFCSAPSAQAQKMHSKKMQMGMNTGDMSMPMVKSRDMDKARAELNEAKAKLQKEGHYACCIKPTCNFCAVAMNSCPCGDNVRANKGGVCGECKGGWMTGYGAIPNKKPEDIQMVGMSEAKMAMDMRAMKMNMGQKSTMKHGMK